ncbi:hypothetical protein [Streptomyces sp. SP2-10]|nr:hypothetical protein [Streptomyces sp. SP2-10]MBY8846641.1 hypothetical protein [Streptomyces sp. SP2-10]
MTPGIGYYCRYYKGIAYTDFGDRGNKVKETGLEGIRHDGPARGAHRPTTLHSRSSCGPRLRLLLHAGDSAGRFLSGVVSATR